MLRANPSIQLGQVVQLDRRGLRARRSANSTSTASGGLGIDAERGSDRPEPARVEEIGHPLTEQVEPAHLGELDELGGGNVRQWPLHASVFPEPDEHTPRPPMRGTWAAWPLGRNSRPRRPISPRRRRRVLDQHQHKVIATLRRDGSPRVSGNELRFIDGEVWLGMMPGSVKALDLLRDPRVAVHGAPPIRRSPTAM